MILDYIVDPFRIISENLAISNFLVCTRFAASTTTIQDDCDQNNPMPAEHRNSPNHFNPVLALRLQGSVAETAGLYFLSVL